MSNAAHLRLVHDEEPWDLYDGFDLYLMEIRARETRDFWRPDDPPHGLYDEDLVSRYHECDQTLHPLCRDVTDPCAPDIVSLRRLYDRHRSIWTDPEVVARAKAVLELSIERLRRAEPPPLRLVGS